jgi:hypothetical protein
MVSCMVLMVLFFPPSWCNLAILRLKQM